VNVKRFNILTLIILSSLFGHAYAESLDDYVIQGNHMYHEGNFSDALAQYDKVPPEQGEDPVVLYNRANCFYKLADYSGAIELFQRASVKSKDMNLVSQAEYNLGNCHYQEGVKQLDSNLQKAWEELSESVRYYRRALDINPDDADATRNIAAVRLLMKDLLDKIKKEQEKQQQEQKEQDLAQKIKELLQRQIGLVQQTAQTLNALPDPNQPHQQAKDMLVGQADEQLKLKDDTIEVNEEAQQMLEQLLTQDAAQNAPGAVADPNAALQIQQQKQIMETVTQELPQAIDHQDNAATHLSEVQGKAALEAQGQAAECLKRALEAFPKQPQQQQQQNNDQNQQNQQQQPQPDSQQQDEQNQEQQQPQAIAPDATARDILDEEKQRKEQRPPGKQGGYRAVDKDW
jgi:tetratricopeptide (TPR) repeat protein